jgi:uncharacterized phiE125 gp8 family phage protein
MVPYSIVCTHAPVNPALSLTEAKAYMKITANHDDTLITGIIKSVIQSCESYTSLALITQEWHVVYRSFPNRVITLPKRPATKIHEVELTSYQGKASLYAPEFYKFTPETSELVFYLQPLSYLISIKFNAGFGDTYVAIPEEIRLVMCEHVAYLYENRGVAEAFPMSLYNNFKCYRL